MRAYLFPTLTKDQIEVKVKKVTQGGALLLLYKTARTDYDILDDVLGPDGWKVEYSEIKGNLYCTLSVWSDARGEWISKQNCGTESREDGEGNEKKGEASDAMKRAGVTLGIGRELYTSPVIYANVPTTPKGNGYELADRYQTFDVKEIGYDEQRRINRLVIVDNKGAQVFTFPRGNAAPAANQNVQAPKGQAAPAAFVPSGHIDPAGEAMGHDKPPITRRTTFQVNEIKRLCNDTQYAILQEKHGKDLDALSFTVAQKFITEIKAKNGGN